MRFDIITIFPDFFQGPFSHGIIRRAQEAGLVEIKVQNLREFTDDRHRTVDDRPFGGGDGMVLKAEPIFRAVESLIEQQAGAQRRAIILLSPQGKPFSQADAFRLAGMDHLVFICGRYEGVDERVAEHLATEELSIGDFILSGGELAAAVVVDAVVRLVPGALGNEVSRELDSFSFSPPSKGLEESSGEEVGPLSWPQYTRPVDFRGWKVPEILLSGNHQEILKWRRLQAYQKTGRVRPDLLARLEANSAEKAM